VFNDTLREALAIIWSNHPSSMCFAVVIVFLVVVVLFILSVFLVVSL
jgi:hypothetical protein